MSSAVCVLLKTEMQHRRWGETAEAGRLSPVRLFCWRVFYQTLDFPSWDGVNWRFCVFPGEWEMLSVYHGMMGKIKTEGGTINGKINRELNLTPQETGFEPKQLGTQRNVIYMRDCCLTGRLFHCRVEKKVCDHPLCVTAVPAVSTRGQSVWCWWYCRLFIYRIFCMYYMLMFDMFAIICVSITKINQTTKNKGYTIDVESELNRHSHSLWSL